MTKHPMHMEVLCKTSLSCHCFILYENSGEGTQTCVIFSSILGQLCFYTRLRDRRVLSLGQACPCSSYLQDRGQGDGRRMCPKEQPKDQYGSELLQHLIPVMESFLRDKEHPQRQEKQAHDRGGKGVCPPQLPPAPALQLGATTSWHHCAPFL